MPDEEYVPREEVISHLDEVLSTMDEVTRNKTLTRLSSGWFTTKEDAIRQIRERSTPYAKALYLLAEAYYINSTADSHT